MKRSSIHTWFLIGGLLPILIGCASRPQEQIPVEKPPPLADGMWQEIKEEILIASTLAHSEAQDYTRQAMADWMLRVRENTDSQFVPWYTGYWIQQWIGIKAAWYEFNLDEGDPPVQDYLMDYIQERYNELVLEPAGIPEDPGMITAQAAVRYVRLLSSQLQCIPKMYTVSLLSLKHKLGEIPLITLADGGQDNTPLSILLEHSDLSGVPAFESLLIHIVSTVDPHDSTAGREPLRLVAEDMIARLVAELPLRAGGSAAALLVGEPVGLFITAGVTAWSLELHEEKKPEIELQLRKALDVGLRNMWEVLMNDPRLGVMFPVNHMCQQIESRIFSHQALEAVLRTCQSQLRNNLFIH